VIVSCNQDKYPGSIEPPFRPLDLIDSKGNRISGNFVEAYDKEEGKVWRIQLKDSNSNSKIPKTVLRNIQTGEIHEYEEGRVWLPKGWEEILMVEIERHPPPLMEALPE